MRAAANYVYDRVVAVIEGIGHFAFNYGRNRAARRIEEGSMKVSAILLISCESDGRLLNARRKLSSDSVHVN